MLRWRILASLVIALTLAETVNAQSYSLAEAPDANSYFHIRLAMSLKGQLKLQQGGKELVLEETATATHEFMERLIAAEKDSVAKSVRIYKTAKVNIIVEREKMERTLRSDRQFLVSMRGREGMLTYSPSGTLTRDELDVVDHFDTVALAGMLPSGEVKIGETWKVSNAAAQALCHLQALSEQSLTGRLTEVKDDIAVIQVNGSASGIDQGASAKSDIQAICRFDLKKERIIAVDWTQKDQRDSGPVSPACTLEATINLARTPTEPADELSDLALAKVPEGEPARALTDLEFKDAKNRYELQHAREWRLVGQGPEHTVMRLMDRGEFIAQVTVAPWKKAEPGKHLSPDEVKEIIANMHGWAQDTLIKAEEVTTPSGKWAYLVAGEGDLDGLRAVQYFYFIASPTGEQAMLTFSMTPAQVQKLGSRDVEFVRGFKLPGAKQAGAGGR